MKNKQNRKKDTGKHKDVVLIAKLLSSKNKTIRKLLACKDEVEYDNVLSELTKEELSSMQSEMRTLLVETGNSKHR